MPIYKKIYEPNLETDRAKNVKGETVYIDDAESGRKGYFCFGCDKKMQANIQRKNPNFRSYFSHIPVDVLKGEKKCTYSNREHRELIATDILQRIKRIKVPRVLKFPPNGAKGNPVELTKEKFISAHKVKSQLTFYEDKEGIIYNGKNPEIGNRYLLLRPDVTFFNEKDEAILFIELVDTHKVTDEKKIKLRRLGIDTISIIVPRASDQEIEENFKSVQRVKWEYNDEEARTSYISVSYRAPKGVLEFDQQQRRIFGESVSCRQSRINNTIRSLRKCLEGEFYDNIKRDFEREIFRVKKATEASQKRLADLEKRYDEEAFSEIAGRFEDFEREKSEFERAEEIFGTAKSGMEKLYFGKRNELEEQFREVENFELTKKSTERETADLDHRIREVFQNREGIEERVLRELEIKNRGDSSELSRRIKILLESKRHVSNFADAKCENERYKSAYEFFRKGTWEKE